MTPLRDLPSGQVIELQTAEWPGEAPSLSVLLYQPPTSTARWRVRVEVITENGSAVLGELVTHAPSAGAPPNRVIAIASCPGGRGWRLLVKLESGAPSSSEIIDMAASPCCGSRAFEAVGGDDVDELGGVGLSAPSYVATGGVDGVVAVPAGAVVTGIAAFTSQAGATIEADGLGNTVPVPQGGDADLSPPWWVDPESGELRGALRGPVNITFTNTDGYAVEMAV